MIIALRNDKLSQFHNNTYKLITSKTIMEKDIGKIQKGEYEGTVTEIVVGIREYNGKTGVDIREFTTSEKYTGPTKKGLRIPADKFLEFKEMINSVNPEDLKSSEGEGQEQTALPSEEPKSEENTEEASKSDVADY